MKFHIFIRRDCPCSVRALNVLAGARERLGFTYETIAIDEHLELLALHGASAPVVTLDGRVRFRGRVDLPLLERLVAGERGSRSRPGG